MDAEETSIVRLDRCAEQEACRRAVHLSIEVRAVLAHTKVLMRTTRSYSGQHVVQGIAHRGLLLRVERVDRAHQNFERIARNYFMPFVRQAESNASPIGLGSLSDQIPTSLKRLNGL